MNENTKQTMQECIDKLKNVYEYEKPKSIYEYSTIVPNNYLLPLIHAAEEVQETNKQLEKERDDIYADYQDLGKEKLRLEEENQVVRGANNYWVMKFCEANNKNKEQEKMIKLMAKAFKQDDIRNEDEIIEYFRNEVKKNEKPEKN